jgi:hypothetical protein
MAINRITAPSASPASIADYSAIVAQLAALVLDRERPPRVSGSNVLQGALLNVGGILYYAASDTAITGSASAFVKITPSGATASAEFVANLTGVTWNKSYNGYYDASGNLYLFDYFAVGNYAIPGCGPISKVVASQGNYTNIAEIKMPGSGNVRAKYSITISVGGVATGDIKLYKNGVAIGAEHEVTDDSPTGSYYDDITIVKGDLIQAYYKSSGSVSSVTVMLAVCTADAGVAV